MEDFILLLKKLKNKKIKHYVFLLCFVYFCSLCFAWSNRKDLDIKIEINGKKITVNNKLCQLLGGTEGELRAVLGDPSLKTGTFGGKDYLYYDYDIHAIVNDNSEVKTLFFCLYDIASFVDKCEYIKGKIKSVKIDDILLTSTSDYEQLCSVLNKRNIVFSKKEDGTAYRIIINDYNEKDIYLGFYKDNGCKIYRIGIMESKRT